MTNREKQLKYFFTERMKQICYLSIVSSNYKPVYSASEIDMKIRYEIYLDKLQKWAYKMEKWSKKNIDLFPIDINNINKNEKYMLSEDEQRELSLKIIGKPFTETEVLHTFKTKETL